VELFFPQLYKPYELKTIICSTQKTIEYEMSSTDRRLNVSASECLYLAAQLIHNEAENHQKPSKVTPGWKKRLKKGLLNFN